MTTMFFWTSQGISNYNAGFVSYHTRRWKGLTVETNFTYGHSLDDSGLNQDFDTATTNAYNLRYDYGTSVFDRKFVLQPARHVRAAVPVSWYCREVSKWLGGRTDFHRLHGPAAESAGWIGSGIRPRQQQRRFRRHSADSGYVRQQRALRRNRKRPSGD